MHRIYILVATLLIVSACNNNSDKNLSQSEAQSDDTLNAYFERYSEKFIDELLAMDPEWATQVGVHRFDSLLSIPDEESRKKNLLFVNAHLDSLSHYAKERLTSSHRIDLQLLENSLQSRKWQIETLKEYEWNPSLFNNTGLIAFMLTEPYKPLEERLKDCAARLRKFEAYYTTASRQIKNPVPELQALAIDQNMGGLSVIEKDFADSVKHSKLDQEEQKTMLATAREAAGAVKDYVQFLKSLKPVSPRSFRLGKELYEQKFRYDIQSSFTAAQLYDSAVARKAYLHGEMAKICKDLWPKYFGKTSPLTDTLALIKKMIDTISVKHVKPLEFQAAIEQQLPELVAFIKAKNLLYIDPSKPLVVRKEPAYMAGVAGASISAPGPFDKGGNTYYNVGSLEGWPAEKAESYLREYNHYILQILNIHEAIPGHYTQLVYANRSPSLVKSLFGNGAMIEGWAVYTEQMMLENGYGNNEPEMWLMWYKWNLRTVCNTILDYGVHVNNLSKNDALHLLTKEAFQQQAEAEGKWKRVSVTSVQLTSYFAGYKEIIELRELLKKKEPKAFDLRVFHEKFLSYGSAPVKYISQMMTE